MKILPVLIIIFLAITVAAFSFNFQNYKPVTLDEIVKIINIEKKELEEKKRIAGMTIFNKNHKLAIKLTKYPIERKESYKDELDKYYKIGGISGPNPDEFGKLFNYQMEYLYEGINFIFIFHGQLIEYLRKEILLNERVDLYVVFGCYFDEGNKAIILVNEFRKIPKENILNTIKEVGGIKFTYIPDGSFIMGSPKGEGDDNERPQHKVYINSFWMSIYEITQKQYQSVMDSNPSVFKGANLPVEQVSWIDAMNFCYRLGKMTKENIDLPSEAQWEYACRAGTTTQYYWGDMPNNDYFWAGKNTNDKTHDVGQKKQNAWGLYDMSGNVWEWCKDVYNDNYYSVSPDTDPKGPSFLVQIERSNDLHVLRGGGFYRDYGLRSASRSSEYPVEKSDSVGFRIILIPKVEKPKPTKTNKVI